MCCGGAALWQGAVEGLQAALWGSEGGCGVGARAGKRGDLGWR